jgi:hypothetical protein
MRRAVLAVIVLLLIGAGMLATATVPEHRTAYLGAVFTPDGAAVVTVRHELDAWVFGPGWEMVTPPARVRIRRDRYFVVRLDRTTGRERVLATLPPSPIEGTWLRAYRSQGYGYGYPQAGLSWPNGTLEWRVSLTTAGSDRQRVYGIASRAPAWTPVQTAAVSGDDRAVLSGDDEVVVVPSAPCAVLLLNEARKTVRALSTLDRCRNPLSLEFADTRQYANRARLERLARIEAMRAEVIRAARTGGASEGQAALDAIDALEQAGYYARPAQLVATLLSREETAARRAQGTLAPLFSISAMEFRVGLFPDIERATAAPGTEVRYAGPYLRHSEFKTSDAINAAIAAGTHQFFVETDRGIARLYLVPPRGPTR